MKQAIEITTQRKMFLMAGSTACVGQASDK